MDGERFDHVVLGAGLAGLAAALRQRRDRSGATLLVVEATAHTGGAVRTQRSNGFVCELGPFAFARDEVAPVLARLDRPPPLIEPLPDAHVGFRFDGAGLVPVDVAPLPVSFATGNEELPQACRRELGASLRLGRAATALRPVDGGWEIVLGGEAAGRVRADRLTLALPPAATATLLAPFDGALTELATRLGGAARAFVFAGGHGGDLRELRGYGVAPADGLATPVAEIVFCTNVFARRALPGRCLVRAELAADGPDDALGATAIDALRRWTGATGALPFAKVHRFAGPADPAAAAELHARAAAIAARFGTLALA